MFALQTAPFKVVGAKRTKAAKASQLGLDVQGKQILDGLQVNLDVKVVDAKGIVCLAQACDTSFPGNLFRSHALSITIFDVIRNSLLGMKLSG